MARLSILNQGMLDDALTNFGRDRGSGTVLPTADLRRGDVYFHTGLACLMVYTGAVWRQIHVAQVADAAARTAISTTYAAALYAGFRARQSDNSTWEWSGTAWFFVGGAPEGDQQLTPATGWVHYNDVTAQWSGLRGWKRGNIVTVTGAVQTNAATVARQVVANLPAGWAPPSQVQAASGGFSVWTDGTLRNASARASGYVESFTITYGV